MFLYHDAYVVLVYLAVSTRKPHIATPAERHCVRGRAHEARVVSTRSYRLSLPPCDVAACAASERNCSLAKCHRPVVSRSFRRRRRAERTCVDGVGCALTMTQEREVWTRVIEVFRDHPYMWDKGHKQYYDRRLRQETIKKMYAIFQELKHDVDIRWFKKKFENMRTTYARELKKVWASKLESNGSDVYVPSLWYFNKLGFLENSMSCHVSVADPLENEFMSSEDLNVSMDSFCSSPKRSSNHLNNASSNDRNTSMEASSSSHKKRRKEPSTENQGCKLKVTEIRATTTDERDERWEVYGRSIGYQMSDLTEKQLVICQKLIADVIFYGKLNKLNEHSHVVTPKYEPDSD